jgi:ribose transport system permease protein
MMASLSQRVGTEVLLLLAMSGVLLVVGSLAFPSFLSPGYLLQQAQIASFLGVVSIGAFAIILIGHIDLSIPWTMTASAMAAASAVGLSAQHPILASLSVPIGLAIGAFIGLVNGLGVAGLRVPSMIWTLAINVVLLGACVLFTGGFAPSGEASGAMRIVAVGRTLGVPNAALLWLAITVVAALVLRKTVFGDNVLAIGNGERAAFLAGVNTRGTIVICFVFAGVMSAIGGLMLAGYSNQAYQGMGETFLLPAIAANVVGGVRLQGGHGSAAAVAAAVLFLTLLTSVLSVFQMSGAFRQIVYGIVMLVTLILYGRFRAESSITGGQI